MLIVNRELFLSLSCQHPGTCSNKLPRLSEVLDGFFHSLSVDLSNTTWAQRGLINKLPGTEYSNHGIQATFSAITSHITFGAVTKDSIVIMIALKEFEQLNKKCSNLKIDTDALLSLKLLYSANLSAEQKALMLRYLMKYETTKNELIGYLLLPKQECRSIIK